MDLDKLGDKTEKAKKYNYLDQEFLKKNIVIATDELKLKKIYISPCLYGFLFLFIYFFNFF